MPSFFEDIVVTPHCDMHVAMSGTPPAKITVYERRYKPDVTTTAGDDKRELVLKDVTSQCTFKIFSPYETPGTRLITPFISIDSTGVITPLAMGINFVHVSHLDVNFFNREHYQIIRVQVHYQMLGWWFGNSSLTVPKDDAFAHTQVSLYALFSDDAKKTDVVGDITGHGYVDLTSSNNAVFEPDADRSGRLWGKTIATAATLSGSFLGSTKTIPVKVVDYKQQRNILEPVQYVKPFEQAHNIIFIPEGFIDSSDDRNRFDEIVTKITEDFFRKPRHAPYNILQGSFNVFKAFHPSEQRTITCGTRINDEDDPKLVKGFQVPYNNRVSSTAANPYTPEELVMNVGLPLRNETGTAQQLMNLWAGQSLPNYKAERVDSDLIGVWKKQRSVGILEARDSFFGMSYGRRYADRLSGVSQNQLPIPATDSPSPVLSAFIGRLYEWFYTGPTRLISPDPRRHPPQIFKSNESSPGNIVIQYLKSLHYRYDPAQHIGLQWEPDVNNNLFKPSVGFVGIIVNDGISGGGNLNDSSMVTSSINSLQVIGFQYANTATEKVMRRNPPADIPLDIDKVINTMAHEFGHSFNLGDEYESFSGDKPVQGGNYDNVAGLNDLQLDANFATNRLLNPDKVKWFELLRIELSSMLTENSVTDGFDLKVKIDPQYAGKWTEAKTQNKLVHIRKPKIAADGKQLPMPSDDAHYLVRLQIINVDPDGFIKLGGPDIPSPPLPVFPKGSFIFIPRRTETGDLQFLVEKKVFNFLKNDATNKNLPLNKDDDRTKVKREADEPKDIPDFSPNCKAHKTIGVYEGARYYTGMQYRPAGNCKMRNSHDTEDSGGQFCHVCKYLIVNRVDPEMLDVLDRNYYPKAKKS